MLIKLDQEHLQIAEMVRQFAEKEIKPLAAEIDEEERFPIESIPKLAEMGLMGVTFPEEYGGFGADYLTYVMCLEEISKVCATTGTILAAHNSLYLWPIYTFGTEEQKQKYLPDYIAGKKIGGFALTEPNAGSDAAMQQTTAVDKGDYFLLNGSKMFITNSTEASAFVVAAMTDKTLGNKGISLFIVEKEWEGFSIGKHERKMGIRGSATSEIFFNDVKVPKENLLGKVGEGFKLAMATLDGARMGVAAQALGIAAGAIDETIKYVKDRVQFGKPIAKFQNTQFQLADMRTKTEAARMLIYEAAAAKDCGEPFGHLSAMAKLYAAENASDVTRRCLQLFGGYGYIREYPIERMMRDAKITEIYEGTSEVQRMVISGWMGVK